MSLAFPTLLVFLLILPGLILRYSYSRGSWGWASPTSTYKLSDEVAFGIIHSLVLHALWISGYSLLVRKPDLFPLLTLLTGHFGREDVYFATSIGALSSNGTHIAAYFLSLYGFSAAAGNRLHWFVRTFRLDHKIKLLRFNNYWYYMLTGEVVCFTEDNPLFRGRKPDGVYLSTVVTHGNDSFLYWGIISDFTFDSQGNPDTIALAGAYRRKLSEDRDSPDAPNVQTDSRYYEVRGDYLILRHSEMRTLNLDYFWLEDA